jgi:hypothetical protein
MKDVWKRIYNKIEAKNQFLREAWFDTWCIYNENNSEWDTKIVYDHITVNNEFDAIIPYSFQKKGPFKFASLAGKFVPHRGIPNTGVHAELIEKTVQKISEIKDIDGFRFGFVEETDKFIIGLSEELKRQKWNFINNPFEYAYGMELPKTEEEYLNSLGRKMKYNLSSRRRRFEETGHVEFKYFTNEAPHIWEKVFKDIAEIEENSWVNERGELRVGGDENQRFWNKLITDDWFSQAMKVNICYLDGEPVSHNLSFDTDDTRYNCDTGYDAKVAKYGVGILMGVENTKQSINAGIRYVNDSFGTESYKMQLGREKFTRLTDIIVFPPTVKGKLVFLLVKIKFFIESIKLKQKFREIKRKFSGE